MQQEKLEKLLNQLAAATLEPVAPELSENIKHSIPGDLMLRRGGLDTISIIIDLRISKLVAAAVIIISTVLLAGFLGGRDSTGADLYQDGKLLLRYCTGGIESDSERLVKRLKYEYLIKHGQDVVYYGDVIDSQDSNAVLIQWKLADGRYGVVLGNFQEKTVSADELVGLQSRMLREKPNKK